MATRDQQVVDMMQSIVNVMTAADLLMEEIASDPEQLVKNPRLSSAVLNYIVAKLEANRLIRETVESTDDGS